MSYITIGVYDTHNEAESAIRELEQSGVDRADISYLYVDNTGEITQGQTSDKVAAGAVEKGTAGAVIGGLAGLVVANGILPGLGSFFVAGPLAAALGLTGVLATTAAGAATGAVAGGIIGAFAEWGVSEEDASLYESFVQQGDILVIARTDDRKPKALFDKTNAYEVRQYETA